MKHWMLWASQGFVLLAVAELAWQHWKLVKRVEWLEELKIAEMLKKSWPEPEPDKRFR